MAPTPSPLILPIHLIILAPLVARAITSFARRKGDPWVGWLVFVACLTLLVDTPLFGVVDHLVVTVSRPYFDHYATVTSLVLDAYGVYRGLLTTASVALFVVAIAVRFRSHAYHPGR